MIDMHIGDLFQLVFGFSPLLPGHSPPPGFRNHCHFAFNVDTIHGMHASVRSIGIGFTTIIIHVIIGTGIVDIGIDVGVLNHFTDDICDSRIHPHDFSDKHGVYAARCWPAEFHFQRSGEERRIDGSVGAVFAAAAVAEAIQAHLEASPGDGSTCVAVDEVRD